MAAFSERSRGMLAEWKRNQINRANRAISKRGEVELSNDRIEKNRSVACMRLLYERDQGVQRPRSSSGNRTCRSQLGRLKSDATPGS